MKKLPVIAVISLLATTLVGQSQTVIFNDTFGSGSTLNGTSTPGGTPTASSTSYDVASGKTGACAITANKLLETISSGTTAGYVELQAIFASAPVQLVNVGDSINFTFAFTNTANLLAGGSGSVIDVGLFNSGGTRPVAGSLNASGLTSAITYTNGYCQLWQGYVASIAYTGIAGTKTYTRPWQYYTNNANQDLLFSGAGTGLYNAPGGTQIGSTLTSAVTLTAGAKYTNSFTVLLSAAQTVTIINNLYDSSGNLLSAQTNTTAGGTTYTNYANDYDGLAIGIANKGTSLQPQMTISRITITQNSPAAPAITGLTNQTIIVGNNATLSPVVTGNPTPTYQWFVSTDGGATSNAIGGAISSSLALNDVLSSQDGYIYSLVAANSVGTNAASMTLSAIVTPAITALNNQADYVGSDVMIGSTVTGVPAPTLQWQLNGTNINDGLTGNGSSFTGTTTSTLEINSAQAADTGTYSLIASNSAGSVTNSMYLLVSATDVLPTLAGPNNITVIEGNSGTFIASAYYGLPQPTLQWLDETGTPIAGQTSASLTLNNVQYSQNGYTYSLVANNSVGSVTNTATLTVIVLPAITSQPANLTVTNTQSASFTVGATGVPSPTYQWYRNNSLISSAANNSATNATLILPTTTSTDAGSSYYVQISNAAGTTNSASAILTVNSSMSATAFSPANGATGLCYDTPLTVTFNSTINLGTTGSIKIFNVTNSTTPVDTISAAAGASQSRTFPGDSQAFNSQAFAINGSTVTIYPHPAVLTSNQTYYVTIDNGTFTDAAGANFVGLTATNVWQFSTKMGGPANPTNIVVNPDGSADFLTVQGAVNSIPAGNTTPSIINIRNGIYTEIVDVSGKNNVTFRGQSRLGTLVGYPNNNTYQTPVNGGTTHARMAIKVNANDIAFDNLTLTNMTPQGGSQAEALMIETGAARCIVNNCTIVSRQDTILANTSTSQAYFYKSTVLGNYDYIWGGGNLYFDQCVMDTIAGTSGDNLTAARTGTAATSSTTYPWSNPGSTYTANGMSFVNCSFTADSGVGTVTLADGNGSAGELVSWYGCDFATNYITPSTTLFSGNYLFWQNANTMTNSPVTFAAPITTIGVTNNDPRLLAATNIPTWFYGWTPQLAPNILTNPASQAVTSGSPATFTVVATGIPDPTYQWLTNGVPISGATGATFTIASTALSDANSYSVVVTTPAGSVTSSPATLTVNPNTAPVFTGPPAGTNITINVGVSLSVACPATDSDLPPQTLTYSLLTGPSGAAVDSSSGNLIWRPTTSFAGTVNPVQVVVTDNGTPSLSATNSFGVSVNALTQPSTTSSSYSGGQFSVSVSGQIGPDYELQGTTNLDGGTWTTIATTNSPTTMPVILADPNAGSQPMMFYRIVTGPPLP